MAFPAVEPEPSWTPLHTWAHQAALTELTAGLQEQLDLEARDSMVLITTAARASDSHFAQGRTPLMVAAAGNTGGADPLPAVQVLIEAGARMSARDAAGLNAVHYAAMYGHKDVLCLLADPTFKPTRQAPRRVVITLNDLPKPPAPTSPNCIEAAKPVYPSSKGHTSHGSRRYRCPLEGPSNTEERPLHLACKAGHLEVVRAILSRSANPNHPDHNGRTAIHNAVLAAALVGEELAIQLLQLLLNRKFRTSVALKDADGATALGLALKHGFTEVAAVLHQLGGASQAAMPVMRAADPPCDSRFAAAVAAADDNAACNLVVAGELVDCAPEPMNGWHPIHVAARCGRHDAVSTLVKARVPLEHRDHQGRTALMLAVEAGTCRTVDGAVNSLEALLHAQSSATARDHRGMTVVHHAVLGGRVECVEAMLRFRPRPHLQAENNQEDTALHLAALCGHAPMVQLLLDHGALIDKRNCRGETALHCAVLGSGSAEGGMLATAKVLLQVDQKADFNAQTSSGRSALALAAANGSLEMVTTLLASKPHVGRAGGRGLDLDSVDREGSTAAHGAARNGWTDIVEALENAGACMLAVNNEGHTARQLLDAEEMEQVLDSVETMSL